MKLKLSDKAIRRIAQQINNRNPRIEIAWREGDNYYSEWVDLADKSIEDIQQILDSHENSSIFDTEGFGDWENMEDQPLETIMLAASIILELGSPDEYFRVGL